MSTRLRRIGKTPWVLFVVCASLLIPRFAFGQSPPALGEALRFALLSLSSVPCPAPKKDPCGRVRLGAVNTVFKVGVLSTNIGGLQGRFTRGLFVAGDIVASADSGLPFAVRLGPGVVGGEVITAGGAVIDKGPRTKILGGTDDSGTSPKLDVLSQAMIDAMAAADAIALLAPTQTMGILTGGETISATVAGLNVVKVAGIVMRPRGQVVTVSGNPDDIMIINVEKDPALTDRGNGRVSLASGSRIELAGGLTPERVLINVIGPEDPSASRKEKIIKIGRRAVLPGTMIAKNRHIRVGTQGLITGALIAGGEIRTSRQNTFFFASFLPSCGNGIIDQPDEQCDASDLGGETCESQGFALGGTLSCSVDCTFDFGGCGQVGFGAAASFALLVTGNNSASLNSQTVATGDVGAVTIASGTDVRVQSDVIASADTGTAVGLFTGFIGGDVVTCGGSVNNFDTVIAGSIIVDPTCTHLKAQKLAQAIIDAEEVASEAAALTPQLTLGTEDGDPPLTISVPGSGLKVVEIAGIVQPPPAGATVIVIDGAPTDIFVINVTGDFNLASNSTIGLTGGITPNRVLLNVVGSGTEVSIGTNSLVSGTVLAVARSLRAKNGTTITGGLMAEGPIQMEPDASALGNTFVGF